VVWQQIRMSMIVKIIAVSIHRKNSFMIARAFRDMVA
jgi:hypothetical protein